MEAFSPFALLGIAEPARADAKWLELDGEHGVQSPEGSWFDSSRPHADLGPVQVRAVRSNPREAALRARCRTPGA